jgi:capsular polysaccharide biosynthesis protein
MGIGDLYHALWRHKYFIILMTALLAAAVWFLTSRQTKIYKASTLVRVDQNVVDPADLRGALEAGQTLVRTYAIIAETGRINLDIQRQLAGKVPPGEVNISAEPGEDVELLWLSAESPSPLHAQMIANAAPQALKDYVQESRRFVVPGATTTDATGTTTAAPQVVARERVDVVDQASLPSSPARPNMTLNLALAVVLGLIFNGALALIITLVGDRWRDTEELERLTGRPVLASIPHLQLVAPGPTAPAPESGAPVRPTKASARG